MGIDEIIVGLDIRDGKVAISGWQENTAIDYLDLARQMESMGLKRVIITDIATDGMLSGPRLESMIDIASKTNLKVIASGGVSRPKDLVSIAKAEKRGIEGVIIGKAIYEKKLSLKRAITKYPQPETGKD